MIEIYTDGSCLKNPGGAGGYAAVILVNGKNTQEIVGGEPSTTNNRMEMMAVIEGLKIFGSGTAICVYSDSKYVIEGFSRGYVKKWKKNNWTTSSKTPVKNQDLWEVLDRIHSRLTVSWTWVKGHAGDEWNERCDVLARTEAERQRDCAGTSGVVESDTCKPVVPEINEYPTARGLYVAYVDGSFPGWADKQLLFYDSDCDSWRHKGSDQTFRGTVYACIGPIPVMELTK